MTRDGTMPMERRTTQAVPLVGRPADLAQASLPFAVQSWIMPHDPVTGPAGGKKTAQLGSAEDYTGATTGGYLDHTRGTEIYKGAQFVAQRRYSGPVASL
jgi:hypothetical protein